MRLSLAAAFLAVSAASAAAADLPIYTKAPPPPVAVFTWTGCYVGANGGGLWANKRWVNTDTTTPFYGTVVTTHTASGGMAGGEVGCDYQTGPWVIGIDGSYDWVNATGSGTDNNNPRFSDETNVQGFGTITVRGGYTITPQWLIYARGGVAFERDRYNVNQTNIPLLTTALTTFSPNPLATGSQDRAGGIVGIGAEYLIAKNWSVFGEFDYADFGVRTITLQNTINQRPFLTTDIRERKEVVRVGVNYRFWTGAPAAIAARY
jgi:outer membrane immunogenic protein